MSAPVFTPLRQGPRLAGNVKGPTGFTSAANAMWLMQDGRVLVNLNNSTNLVALSPEIPQRSRRAGAYRRLAKLMSQLGWTAVRVRGLTRGGYLEQVRGFARDGRSQHGLHPAMRDRAPIVGASV